MKLMRTLLLFGGLLVGASVYACYTWAPNSRPCHKGLCIDAYIDGELISWICSTDGPNMDSAWTACKPDLTKYNESSTIQCTYMKTWGDIYGNDGSQSITITAQPTYSGYNDCDDCGG